MFLLLIITLPISGWSAIKADYVSKEVTIRSDAGGAIGICDLPGTLLIPKAGTPKAITTADSIRVNSSVLSALENWLTEL
jgi:hypothetical protein